MKELRTLNVTMGDGFRSRVIAAREAASAAFKTKELQADYLRARKRAASLKPACAAVGAAIVIADLRARKRAASLKPLLVVLVLAPSIIISARESARPR